MSGNISLFIGQFVRRAYTGKHFYSKMPEKRILGSYSKEFGGMKLTSP